MRLRLVLGAWGTILGVTLVLVACGAPTPTGLVTPATTQAPTFVAGGACLLVPNMDELVGKTAVGQPGAYTLNDVDRCIWTFETDPARYVTVSVAVRQAHDDAIDAFGEGETVAGLGDDARWWSANGTLSVALGGNTLQFTLELDDADVSKELAVSIAQAAFQNLT